jgi:hypothetical protein
LAAGTSFALRLVIVLQMRSPYLFYDELTGPAVARHLSGTEVSTYGIGSTPLYGLILTPLAAVFGEPSNFYTCTLVLNAALASLLGPLLFRIAKSVLDLDDREAAMGAVVGSVTASTIGYSALMVPEVLLTVVTAASILAVDRFLSEPECLVSRAAVLGSIGLLLASHPRAIVGGVAFVLTVSEHLRRRAINTGPAATVIVGTFAMWLIVTTATQALHRSIYIQGSPALDHLSILRIALEQPALVARSAIGTSFTLAAATAGLVFVGVVTMIVAAFRQRRDLRSSAVYPLLLLTGTVALSALFVGRLMVNDGRRVDAFTYARYVDHLVPVLVVYAAAGWKSSSIRWTGLSIGGAVIVAGGLVADRVYDQWFWIGPNAQSNHVGIHWIKNFENVLDISRVWTYGFLLVLLVALGSAWSRTRAVAYLSVGLVGAVAGASFVLLWADELQDVPPIAAQLERQTDLVVGVPIPTVSPITAQYIEFWAPDARIQPYLGDRPENVTALLLPSSGTPPPGAYLIADDPDTGVALWGYEP